MKAIRFSCVLLATLQFGSGVAAGARTAPDVTQLRVTDRLAGLQRYYTSHSLDDLKSTVYTLASALDFTTINKQNYVARRRTVVSAWAAVISAVESAYPRFDLNDINDRPANCVVPPGGQYPCGVDPSVISDQRIRAQYASAIAANLAKAQNANLYHRVMVLDMVAMGSLEVTLQQFRKRGAPPDTVALEGILQNAHLSAVRVARIRSMF